MSRAIPTVLAMLLIGAGCARFQARPGFQTVASIAELRKAMGRSGQKVRMKPGTYVVQDTLPDDPKTVFRCSGSDNHFDLRGVTIQLDTKVLANMPKTPAHQLGVYRIEESRNVFEGATFEDTGNHPPKRSLSEFTVTGDDVTFRDCRFIIRGSSPYGVGDLYGKGAGSFVWLQKHAAMSVVGDRCLIERCDFRIHTYGHAIHMHGAQDTVIRQTKVVGDLRLADELYAETAGPVVKYDYKVMYPPWRKGQPIPKGQMLSLTEDGIRSYLDGKDRDGKKRRTGHITVEDCEVIRMRGGITMALAGGATVTNCTVLDSGGHAYSFPANAKVRNCKGNAAYAPLLTHPYKQVRKMDVELELLESKHELGNHPLVLLTGDSGHRIKITYAGKNSPRTLRPIIVGSAGDRYRPDNCPADQLPKHHIAKQVILDNQTPHPVELTKYAIDCQITSQAPVTDQGTDNQVK
jgi:hypothetical protein